MAIDKLVNLLASITLIEMMVAIGLGVTLAELTAVMRNTRLLVRAALANYILAPAAAVALLALFKVQPMVATGFVITVVCPGAPYGPMFTAIAKGNVAAAVGLMVVLAGSSALLAPLLLKLLIPLVTGDSSLRVNTVKMLCTLVFSQLLPLCAGLWVRQRHPGPAQKLLKPAARASTILNLLLITVILAAQWRMLIAIRFIGYVGMLLLVVATFAAGWVLAEHSADSRKTLALMTSVRNAGVALVIATASFPSTPVIPATIAYALFQTLAVAVIAVFWGKWSGPRHLPGKV